MGDRGTITEWMYKYYLKAITSFIYYSALPNNTYELMKFLKPVSV